MSFDNPKRMSKQGKNIGHATCLWLMAYCLFLPKFDITVHVHNYSTNVQKALTHEHPSGESADEVKAEGVVFFNT